MLHLPTLITDLALILGCAAVMSLLFKKLKQPIVLGYIVAGFLASPHLSFIPSVIDTANIQTWADIGVIFLLFALGLEFSFKKIIKVGGTAIIATITIVFSMMLLGIAVGSAFGWGRMDCIFLGGMIAMSSTTIIYKAFDDLGLQRKQFAGLVFGILILEDVLAVLLMVMLSTMAISNNFEGTEMLESIGKLIFFLILWFVVGIYLIPGLLKRFRKLMNDETLLIFSLALCFGMVVLASNFGYSQAFGAFIMGSILAETIEAESIDRIVKPLKDLFGAIFFVSVGMMVDPSMIITYALPIAVITIVVILGQSFFGTVGVVLAGRPLKMAIQCGFSLTQIGEFAFIIASLGVSLKVTSSFLYPIVVAVSVITIFITPYLIRVAEPVSKWVDNHLPANIKRRMERYTFGTRSVVNQENLWRRLLVPIVRSTIIYSIISISIVALSFRFFVPLLQLHLPNMLASLLSAVVIILLISPFLRSMMVNKLNSHEFITLWQESLTNRAPLLSTIVIRIMIAAGLIIFVITSLFRISVGLLIGLTFGVVVFLLSSHKLKKHSVLIEQKFFQNLRSRDIMDEYLGKKKPEYAGHLLTQDLHLAVFALPLESAWAGKTLKDLRLRQKYDVDVASIIRGRRRLNIPGGSCRLFPQDKIQVIGTDEQLGLFSDDMLHDVILVDNLDYEKREMTLHQLIIDANSIFLGKTLQESNIREKYHCLIAGVKRGNGPLIAPDVDTPFEEGDLVWVVGENKNIHQLVNNKKQEYEK